MSLSKEIVKYVADLSRIELDESELIRLSKQLQDIVDFIGKLSEVDTKDIEPTSHILPIKDVLRQDIVKDSLPIDKTLANQPQKDDNFFSVPKVIE